MDVESDRGAFGPILRRLRLSAGLSQEVLAERARLSVESVSALERGRRRAPYRETIRMLADALDLPEAQRRELESAAKRARPQAVEAVRFESDEAVAESAEIDAIVEHRGNLIRSLSAFYNRQREVAELTEMIPKHRLYSLVGAGGIGKTRIATEVGWKLFEGFPDGVWFIDFAPLDDHSLVTRTLFETLGIPADEGKPELETLKHHLRRRSALLIIDNCEHVLEQTAALIEALLSACDGLRIVATSREPLRIVGERVYRIPSLETPNAADAVDAERFLAFASVALFVDRAKAANSDFVYDQASATAIARICRRLDGIALAIELAASRTAVLHPRQIDAQLEQHFRILSGGRRTALPRQQTMYAAMHWSYDRLDDLEQRYFRRLAIFPNGFSLTAAYSLLATAADTGTNPLDVLTSLVDKSLIVADTNAAATRYRLLEPIRAFGIEMLKKAGETDAVRAAFLKWCSDFVRSAHDDWATMPSADWLARVEPEIENLRACLIWAVDGRNDIESGQRLIASARRVWGRLSPHEGAAWVAAAKRSIGPNSPASVQANLALAEAHLHVALQQYTVVYRAAREFAALTDSDDVLELAEAQCFSGLALTRLGRGVEGEAQMAASIAIFRAHGADQLAATGITDLAAAHLMRDDLTEARRLFREALAMFRKLGNKRGITSVAGNLAETEYAAGDVAAAVQLCREALSTSGSGREARVCLSNLSAYLIRIGDFDRAREYARESLLQRGLARADVDVALALQHLATVAALTATVADDERPIRAAGLLGFVDGQLTSFEVTRLPTDSYEYNVLVTTLASALGAERLASLMDRGRAWTEDEAIEQALQI